MCFSSSLLTFELADQAEDAVSEKSHREAFSTGVTTFTFFHWCTGSMVAGAV